MSNQVVYRRHPLFDRPAAVTGIDLAIEPNGDLVTHLGDIATISGVDLIVKALLRRLYTPPNGYQRWVRKSDGLEVVDVSYGNQALEYLSDPSTSSLLLDIERAFKAVIAEEPRIELLGLHVQQNSNFTDIQVKVDYRILSEEELRTLMVKIAI